MPSQYRLSSLVYELVSDLEAMSGDPYVFDMLDWSQPLTSHALLRFSRDSILRKCAYSFLVEEFRRDLRKNPEHWLETDRCDALCSDFKFYAVEIPSFPAYRKRWRIQDPEDEDDALEAWTQDHESAFLSLFRYYSREAEHILFLNRHFLLSFHSSLAEFLRVSVGKGRTPSIPIPRVTIPAWVKRAVFFRDAGRCALCNTDLSGLLDIEKDEHYDHMVALASGGVNDPTNIQLTCRRYNLKKHKNAASSFLYREWWKNEEAEERFSRRRVRVPVPNRKSVDGRLKVKKSTKKTSPVERQGAKPSVPLAATSGCRTAVRG
jgi:hypothetical protein